MIGRGEIKIEGGPPKGPTASSTATLVDASSISFSETNEGILMVPFPPHAVPIKIIAHDEVSIGGQYPDMPCASPGARPCVISTCTEV